MTTALDLCTVAAKKLGAIQAVGESLSAADANDSLDVLNSMLDSLALDRLLVYQIKQSNFSWAGGQSSRTIGSGGNFNTAWPPRIEKGTFFRNSSNEDFEVEVTHDRGVYDRITAKSVTTTYPEILFFDRAYPLGTLYAYPVPSATLTLYLNVWQILQSFATLTTDLSLPPGYQHMIEHNLTIELESVFDMEAPASVVRIAGQSKARLKRVNAPSMISTLDPGILGVGRSSDIRAGR